MTKEKITLSELKARTQFMRTIDDPSDSQFLRFIDQRYGDFEKAPERLRWPSYFSSNLDLRYRERADWQNVDPRICEFAFRFMAAMHRMQIPFYVHSAYRTKAEQDNLLRAKRTKTIFPNAAHCQGMAVDLVHARYHWELSKPEWDFVYKIGSDIHHEMMQTTKPSDRYQLTWGGHWSFYDPAHWEIRGWNDPANLKTARQLIDKERIPLRFPQTPRVACRQEVWRRLVR